MNKTTENRLGGELRSHQAARRLLEELRRGRYADAAQLPSELELADVLGVSRTVVRDALSDLERDGYVERVRGIGTLVNRDVVRVENRMDQKLEFNRMIRSIGRVPHSDNLMVTRRLPCRSWPQSSALTRSASTHLCLCAAGYWPMKRRCSTPPIFCRWRCLAASGWIRSISAARSLRSWSSTAMWRSPRR